jgi:hypothetical protein
MTASTMIRRLHEIPIPVSFADDTYAESLTKWSVALELNPDDLGKSELFGVLVSVAMSMMLQGKTQEHFADWYQFSWAASEKLGRSNKRNKSNILQLTGPVDRGRIGKDLQKAWDLAERNHQAVVLPDLSPLRQLLENHPSCAMGGVVSTDKSLPAQTRRGRPLKLSLVARVDDMVSEMHRLNQETFTYPCRPAADRLGVDKETVCNALKRLCILGITKQVQRGEVKGLSGEGYADASRYRFRLETPPQAMGGVVSTDKSDQHKPKPKPKKKRSVSKLPLKVMRRIDQEIGPLTYQMVLDHGGTVAHWKRWLRHLDSHRLDSQEDRYRWVVAKNDPQGSVAVDAHQRRQELKAYEFLHGADPGAADRRRMVAAMNAHGTPIGSKVTVSRVLVPGDREWDGTFFWEESYRFLTDCPVAEQMLASLSDDMGMLRAESAIRLMEAYGVVVDREYPA